MKIINFDTGKVVTEHVDSLTIKKEHKNQEMREKRKKEKRLGEINKKIVALKEADERICNQILTEHVNYNLFLGSTKDALDIMGDIVESEQELLFFEKTIKDIGSIPDLILFELIWTDTQDRYQNLKDTGGNVEKVRDVALSVHFVADRLINRLYDLRLQVVFEY